MDSVQERGWENECWSEEMGGECLLSFTVAMDTKKADLLLHECSVNEKRTHTQSNYRHHNHHHLLASPLAKLTTVPRRQMYFAYSKSLSNSVHTFSCVESFRLPATVSSHYHTRREHKTSLVWHQRNYINAHTAQLISSRVFFLMGDDCWALCAWKSPTQQAHLSVHFFHPSNPFSWHLVSCLPPLGLTAYWCRVLCMSVIFGNIVTWGRCWIWVGWRRRIWVKLQLSVQALLFKMSLPFKITCKRGRRGSSDIGFAHLALTSWEEPLYVWCWRSLFS